MIKRLLFTALWLGVATPAFAQISLPYSFTAGTTIVASQVNSNFTALANGALNKAGDTITGAITVDPGVTIDGVDISAFLNGSGNVFAGTAGAVGTPAFSRTTDTNTGIYFPAADELAVTLGGVQKWLVNASGITAFGTNIINSAGKIPALTSTYIASLSFDAANLTGAIADARLSANVPLLNGTNSWSGASNTFTNGILVGTNTSISNSSGFLVLSSGNASYVRTSSVGSVNLADTNASAVNIAAGGGTTTITGPLSTAGIVTTTASYHNDSSTTSVTVGPGANLTVNPSTASIVLLTTSNGDTIQTISGGVTGRIVHVCNVTGGASYSYTTGGNMVTASGSIGPGQCTALRYNGSVWYYF